jgi:hypothetical protein
MGDPISSMPGISPEGMAARVFSSAGMPTVESIRRVLLPERRLSAAIVAFRQSPEHEHLSDGYWHGLGSRCTSILRQVRHLDADPYPPDAYSRSRQKPHVKPHVTHVRSRQKPPHVTRAQPSQTTSCDTRAAVTNHLK